MDDFLDFRKISDVRINMECEIIQEDGKKITGIIAQIISRNDDPRGLLVILKNGHSGRINKITNSLESIKNRILTETHTSENKICFLEPVMQDEQIPHTVQAFLNSKGGHLYIGIFDNGKTELEKFVGLSDEKKIIEKEMIDEGELKLGEELSWLKFLDIYVDRIEKKLRKVLSSEDNLGPLIEYNLISINEKYILEINIKPSKTPVFYKHLSKKNKPKQFEIFYNNEKISSMELDDFYYRDGSSKIPIRSFENFYIYFKNRFIQQ